jgi:hypothetical protein
MDDNVWKAFNSVYNQGTGENCKFISLMAHHNNTSNTIDILIANFKAGFKLAPNIAVIQESKSILGGIYSDSKIIFQEIPRGVTTEDIQTVFDFFYIVAFKNFADMLEVKVDFPKLN